MRRTAEDLIKELEVFDPGGEHAFALLAVEFGTHTEYVNSPDPKRLAKLAEKIHRGDRAIGLIRLVPISKTQGKMETRPLTECDNELIRDRLTQNAAELAQQFEATDPGFRVVRGEN